MAELATLSDNFATKDETKWQHLSGSTLTAWNAYETIVSGQLSIACRSQYDAHLVSADSYDLTGSFGLVEVISRPAQGGDASTEAYFGVQRLNGDNAIFILTGNGAWDTQINVGGSSVFDVYGTYNTTNHRWLRIRESSGTIYFEASPDSITWTTLSSTSGSGLTLTDVRPTFQAGYYGTQATPGSFVVDNFNIPATPPDPGAVRTAMANSMVWDMSARDDNQWTPWNAARHSIVSNRLQIAVPANTNGYYALGTIQSFDLRGNAVVVEVPQTLNNGTSCETQMVVLINGTNSALIFKGNASMIFRHRANGTNSDSGAVTYNATTHRWWRIRESGGTIFWDTSPDGITWTNRRSLASALNWSVVTIQVNAGTYDTSQATPGTAIFDNVNLPHPRSFFSML